MTKASAMIYTVGHSTHPIEAFIGILQAFRVETLVDVRTIPKSRFNPQFVRESLAESLQAAGVGYRYIKDLGGLRRAHRESLNMGWRNVSFRGYADYMQTRTFVDGLEELIAIAKQKSVAIMCAEAVPWRCHRSLVADALLVRGIEVTHIMNRSSGRDHTLTSFAQVSGTSITYPPES